MSKINRILGEWQPGDVHTLKWFASRGVQQRTAFGYSETGALRKIGAGVFARPLDKLSWLGAVRALQQELKISIHVGAKTALELHGSAHNLQASTKPQVDLILAPKTSIPTWVKNNDWDAHFTFRRTNLISAKQDLVETTSHGISIFIASREQAILEFLDTLDLSNGFETAENCLSGLLNLRPKAMQALLEQCTSVKVKRVFLFLVESMELPIFEKLDVSRMDLGKGKRVLVKGGHFNSKYQITVPNDDREGKSVF